MNIVKRFFSIGVLSALLASSTYVSVCHAEDASNVQISNDLKVSEAIDKVKSEPVGILYLKAQGVTLTYLGNDGGNEGYLGVSPDGKMQAFYLSNDKTKLIPGMMYGFKDNKVVNVTGEQIVAMQGRIKLEKEKLNQRQAEFTQHQQSIQDEVSKLNSKENLISQASNQLTGSNVTAPASSNLPVSTAPVAPAVALVASSAPDISKWLASDVNADSFKKSIDNVYWFSVGKKNASIPVLYMVADPTCPHCHSAWRQIQKLVFDGKLNVHVVIISGLPNSMHQATELLSKPNPGLAWLQGEGSSDAAVTDTVSNSSKEYRSATNYIRVNNDYASKMGVQRTPWLAYVKDGKVYQLQGETDLMTFVSGLVK